MNAICNTIKEVFEDQAVMKDQAANSLFGGGAIFHLLSGTMSCGASL